MLIIDAVPALSIVASLGISAVGLGYLLPRIGYRPGGKSEPKPNEIAPGVPRPSNVLAGIIAQKILMSPEDIELTYDLSYPNRWIYTWKSKFPDKPIDVKYTKRPHDGDVISFTVKIDGETYEFKQDEYVIKDAMGKGILLKEERDQAKKAEAHQQKACDLMEKVLGVEKTPKHDCCGSVCLGDDCNHECDCDRR